MALKAPTRIYVNYWPTDENGIHIVEDDPALYFDDTGAPAYKAYAYQSDDGVTWPSTPFRTITIDYEPNADGEHVVYLLMPTPEKYYRVGVSAISGSEETEKTYSAVMFYKMPTSKVGAPKNVKLREEVSRTGVTLEWEAGKDGTNNSVTGYDIQQRDSETGSGWGSWKAAPGSPVSGRSITVYPPDTVGHYRQFRVRTRGSAGSSYYSSYVTSGNTLRRKWDAFGAWADAQIIPRETYIRAEQIAQIRERIDEIRAFYGLAAYAYTPLVARETKIAKWAVLIQELRDAIDEIGTVQGWNTLEVGKPRIAHITQLRAIIDGM